ncbi:MAG: rhomboid family intramembrane serine protease [Candidatus Abyssubacteria bacterium]
MGRYYYGRSEFPFSVRMTTAVKWLIIANVAVFVLQTVSIIALKRDYLTVFFGLTSPLVLRGMIWQPVTYMFLHGGPWHILINMLFLWMFGTEVEGMWGAKSFLRYYFLTGVGAGILSFLAGLGNPHPTIGASGAIFGIMVAFAMLFPNRIVLMFFFFPMRARNAVLLLGAFELWVTLTAGPYAGGVARLAHLGGALVGFLYLKYGDKIRYSLPRIRFTNSTGRQSKEDDWERFMNEEVDPILDKISREGIHSLTWKERKILKKARGKRGGR